MHARECILLCSLFFQVTYYSHSKMQRRPPGFHLGLKVGGVWARKHAAKWLATPTFVAHTPYYMLVHHRQY